MVNKVKQRKYNVKPNKNKARRINFDKNRIKYYNKV